MRLFEPEEAVEELKRRRKDESLLSKTIQVLEEMPEGFPVEPMVYMTRQMTTSLYEDVAFAQKAKELGLSPFWLSYLDDSFCTANPNKVMYWKLPIENEKSPEGYVNHKVIRDPETHNRNKTALGKIETTFHQDGNPVMLHDLHHKMRKVVFNGEAGNYLDTSEWLAKRAVSGGWHEGVGNPAVHYYPALLALFVWHGILFEDYEDGPNFKQLKPLMDNVVDPAARMVQEITGCEPLYVRFKWEDGYGRYPKEVKEVLQSLRSN